jgi:hypothetical protein
MCNRVCEDFRGPMEMEEMDHYFQCLVAEDFCFRPMQLLDLVV